jgi:23S rRNA (guanosine2251-2'-O)-methyltransferase
MQLKKKHCLSVPVLVKNAAMRYQKSKPPAANGQNQWLYGMHPIALALQNPKRQASRLLWAGDGDIPDKIAALARGRGVKIEIIGKSGLAQILGKDGLHQNLALQIKPLPETDLADILEDAKGKSLAIIVILDQVTDPHNVGAVMRSAAAFGALAVVVQDKNSPDITGSLAKAASGAVDLIPLVRVTNIARAIQELQAQDFWCLGLDAAGEKTLANCGLTQGKVALVLGSEGDGMRRLVAEHCDLLVRLPIDRAIDSLNVSNAAAIALYEISRHHGS